MLAVLAVALLGASCGTDPANVTAGTSAAGPATTGQIPPSTVPAVSASDGSIPPTSTPVASIPPVSAPAGSDAPVASAASVPSTTGVATTPPEPQLDGLTVQLTVIGKFDEPIAVAVRPGAPASEPPYLLQRGGVIRRLAEGDDVALDLSDRTAPGGERGVLGMAFAPDAAHLYVNYTDADGRTHVDEFAVDALGAIDGGSRREVLTVKQPYANHNGGDLVFGPDGMLYIGLGDGGDANDPQRRALDVSTLLGKMLRIDPRESPDGMPYSVPADNPYVGVDGARSEIWSIGLRNPWRYSFDRATGDLWIGDVGQGQWEEIDVALAADGGGRGVSYGWSAFEGTHRFNDDQPADGQTSPVWEYEHGDAGCSVTGGYVYRGSAIPALVGAYVFGDYCSGRIWAADPGPAGEIADVHELGKVGDLASFGEDAGGELYALSLRGEVSRLDPGQG